MQRKLTDQVQLKLRFDERLRRKLERAAERSDRSLNSEIVHRLEQSLQSEELLTEIRNEMAAMKTAMIDLQKAMMAKQEEQFEKLYEQWKQEEAEDVLAWSQLDDPDYHDR
jgi:Arc-like DNA binding dprotein